MVSSGVSLTSWGEGGSLALVGHTSSDGVTIKIPYGVLQMFYYIYQPHTPSFPIGLIKTESDFTVRLFKTDLGRWTLVVIVINCWCLSFFGILRPDLSPWGNRNGWFLVTLRCLILRVPRSPNQEVSLSAGKNIGVVLVPCPTWKCVPTVISGGVDISKVPGCHNCYNRLVFSEGHKYYFQDWCLMNSQPTFLFLVYFNSMNYGDIIKRM